MLSVSKKKILIWSLVFIICLEIGFFYFLLKVYQPVPEKPILEKPEQPILEEPELKPLVVEKPKISCEEFEPISEEVSCQEAVSLVLKEYPGEIYSIDRIKVELIGEGEIQPTEYNIWLIKINFKEVVSMPEKLPGMEEVGYVEIGVDRKTKELLILAYGPPFEE